MAVCILRPRSCSNEKEASDIEPHGKQWRSRIPYVLSAYASLLLSTSSTAGVASLDAELSRPFSSLASPDVRVSCRASAVPYQYLPRPRPRPPSAYPIQTFPPPQKYAAEHPSPPGEAFHRRRCSWGQGEIRRQRAAPRGSPPASTMEIMEMDDSYPSSARGLSGIRLPLRRNKIVLRGGRRPSIKRLIPFPRKSKIQLSFAFDVSPPNGRASLLLP